MVDFWSVCDENGKPVGHGGKVGNEYYEYLKDEYEVIQYVNDGMQRFLENGKIHAFSHSLKYGMRKTKRILLNFKCLREVFAREKDSVIWFYVPDIYLFLFLFLAGKGKRRIAVNLYEEYAGSSIKQWVLRQALKKTDRVFVTNQALLSRVPDGILVPDYAYRRERYEKYKTAEKTERAVCLGTMNGKKQLREAVEAFSRSGYPLYIAGQFSSQEQYERLCGMKGNNVTIENRYVDPDEYYQLLASSKFCLIPYDAEFYKNRTSGVIQECLFLDTIPLSDKEILEFSHIRGLGYDSLEELAEADLERMDVQELYETYEEERERFYKYDAVKEKIAGGLKSLF